MATTHSTTRLDIRKLTARIGAEVIGARSDLELDADEVAALRAALNEHKALVFRDVGIDDEGPYAPNMTGYAGTRRRYVDHALVASMTCPGSR